MLLLFPDEDTVLKRWNHYRLKFLVEKIGMSIASQAMYTICGLVDHMIYKSSSEAAKALVLPSASDSVKEI